MKSKQKKQRNQPIRTKKKSTWKCRLKIKAIFWFSLQKIQKIFNLFQTKSNNEKYEKSTRKKNLKKWRKKYLKMQIENQIYISIFFHFGPSFLYILKRKGFGIRPLNFLFFYGGRAFCVQGGRLYLSFFVLSFPSLE